MLLRSLSAASQSLASKPKGLLVPFPDFLVRAFAIESTDFFN
jgi:hypothetical protein